MSDEALGQLLAEVSKTRDAVSGLSTRFGLVEAKIGDYPHAVDLARESVNDLSAEALHARALGSGMCGNLHQLAKNDAAIVIELRRLRADTASAKAAADAARTEAAAARAAANTSAPSALAHKSDRKSNLAAVLGAAAAIISVILASIKG